MATSHSRWLAIPLMGACCLAGYAAGGLRKFVGKSPENVAQVVRRARAGSPDIRTESTALGDFKELLTDSRKDMSVWKVVSRIPLAKIPEALLQVREAKDKAATAEGDRLDEIEIALYFHWAESDPAAALATVNEQTTSPLKEWALASVLTAWMRTDPNAAYQAAKDDAAVSRFARGMLVRTWTAETIFENLKRFPDKSQELMKAYCGICGADENRRNALLLALKDQPVSPERDWACKQLLQSWGYRDFASAISEAENLKLPEVVRAIFHQNLETKPKTALSWSVGKDLPPGGPLWEKGYSSWLLKNRAEAHQWFVEQIPTWLESGHTGAVASFLAEELGLPTNLNPPTEMTAGQRLIELVANWKTTDPQGAEKWLATASADARRLLSGKDKETHE